MGSFFLGNKMETLKQELKEMIITTLRLDDVTVAEISDDMPLFVEGLGLDSIDALEIVVTIEKKYSVKFDDEEKGKKALFSIQTIANFVAEGQK